MPSKFPPDSWTVIVGEWGVDVDRTEDDARTRTGPSALEFLSTGVATEIHQDAVSIDKHWDGLYEAHILWTADRADANDKFRFRIRFLDTNGDDDGATDAILGPIGTIDAFEYGSTSFDFAAAGTQRSISVQITKNFDTDFKLYIDEIVIVKVPIHIAAIKTATQSIPDNTWTTITSWASGGSNGIAFNNSTGIATLPKASRYHIDAMATFTGLSDGQKLEARILEGGSIVLAGGTVLVGAAGEASVHLHRQEQYLVGDTLEFQVRQSGASAARSLVSGSPQRVNFDIRRIL